MNNPVNSPRPYEVELTFQVQTYDIDFAGIVSNIVYIRWLEDLRLKLLEEYLPLEKQMAQGFGPVLASTQIEYNLPLRLFDRPVGRMWVDRLGTTSWTIRAELLLGDKLVSTAVQAGAFVNYSTLRPVPVPEEFRAGLKA